MITDVLIYKVLIDSDIIHDNSVSVNNLVRKYNDMKKATKIPKINLDHI